MINNKAYTEAFCIINAMSYKNRIKIPNRIMNLIKKRMDKNYIFKLEKNIKQTPLLDDTKKILSVLYTDYFSTDEERKIIMAKENLIKSQQRKS